MDNSKPYHSPKLAHSVEEFAEAIGVSRNHAYALVRSGRVRAVRAGARWVIPVKSLEAFLSGEGSDKQGAQPGPRKA